MKEVILERILPDNFLYVTLDYRINIEDFQEISLLRIGFNQYTWCIACRADVVKRCRDYWGVFSVTGLTGGRNVVVGLARW